jgi:hypothetical protein
VSRRGVGIHLGGGFHHAFADHAALARERARAGKAQEWPPALMVVPASERLRTLVTGPEYEAAVERELPHFSFTVRRRAASRS